MIHEVTGDILLSKADAIAHGVAPNDDFKQGLALALRTQWPAMYKDFRHYCKTAGARPGTAWIWGGPGGTRIVNLLTQEGTERHGHGHPGKATLANVNHALRELREVVEKEGLGSVAIPRLATGVGGLDWEDVAPLVREHLGDAGVTVYVYTTFHAGQAADEPGS